MGRRTLAVLTGIAALGLAGCGGTSGAPKPSASATSSSPTATPSPKATAFASTCASALPLSAVSNAAGQPIIGTTSFVEGQPDPGIGRLAYLNCRYGLPDPSTVVPGQPAPAATPLVEIGVSLYASSDRASDRVKGTVEDYTSSGSAPSTTRVGGVPATVLTGGGPTTLVLADGARTVAVSVDPSVLLDTDVLVKLAGLALNQVN